MKSTCKFLLISLLSANFLYSGSRYIKIDSYGNHVSDSTLTWYAIDDTETNLIWEHLTPEKAANTYTWTNAISYCENLTLANASDWRLPNRNEVLSIMDYSLTTPMIDSTYFSGAGDGYYLWSSTSYNTDKAWQLSIKDGYLNYTYKTNSAGQNVMCVRGGL